MLVPPAPETLLPSLQRKGTIVSCSAEDLQKLLYLVLAFIEVDEVWYLSQYPDVKKGVADRTIESAGDHYRRAGYWEGRMPFSPVVDEQWYLKQYPDVRSAVQRGLVKDARSHFLQAGHKEGRMPRPVPIDAAWYRSAYPSARLRLESGVSSSEEDDFLRFGYREGFMSFRPSLLLKSANVPTQ